MFGLGPIGLTIAFFVVGGMAFAVGTVIRLRMFANRQPLKKYPHGGNSK